MAAPSCMCIIAAMACANMMLPVRKRRVGVILLMLLVIGVAVALTMYALRKNISLFYTPSQIALGDAPPNRAIRAGGVVVPGSIVHGLHDLSVAFQLTDYKHTITVHYTGILPDLFREGQGIVAEGHLMDNQQVQATSVLAKHDEKYMPPEVKDALNKVSVNP